MLFTMQILKLGVALFLGWTDDCIVVLVVWMSVSSGKVQVEPSEALQI